MLWTPSKGLGISSNIVANLSVVVFASASKMVYMVHSTFLVALLTSWFAVCIVAFAGGAYAALGEMAFSDAELLVVPPLTSLMLDAGGAGHSAAVPEEVSAEGREEDEELDDAEGAVAEAGMASKSSFLGAVHKGVSSMPWNLPLLMPIYNNVSNRTPSSTCNSRERPQKLKKRLSFTSFLMPPQYCENGSSCHNFFAKSSEP